MRRRSWWVFHSSGELGLRPQPCSQLTAGQNPLVQLHSPRPMAGTATEEEPFLSSVTPTPSNHST